MIRQSSNFPAARRLLRQQPTDDHRQALADGYNHAHGIACHLEPLRIGQTIDLETETGVVVDEDNILDVRIQLALECEDRGRQFSPWEQVASRINAHEHSEELWEAYELGVISAIHHDLGVESCE